MTRLVFSVVLLFSVFACSDDRADFPGLPADAVILAFGNSLTYGTGAGRDKSYPAVLQSLSGRRVINAGNPGEVSADGLRRLPALLDQHNPGLLILCHGGNDILRKKKMDAMQANVRKMIKLARDRNITVVLLGVPRFGLFLSSAPEYGQIAEDTEVIFIEDLLPDILGDNDLKADSVHPNAAGYRKMAETIFATLKDSGVL
ncbi:MAG: arylesterase [Thiotrichales bacterium]|nr:arylesterase [Thiotrichales bacterium]